MCSNGKLKADGGSEIQRLELAALFAVFRPSFSLMLGSFWDCGAGGGGEVGGRGSRLRQGGIKAWVFWDCRF